MAVIVVTAARFLIRHTPDLGADFEAASAINSRGSLDSTKRVDEYGILRHLPRLVQPLIFQCSIPSAQARTRADVNDVRIPGYEFRSYHTRPCCWLHSLARVDASTPVLARWLCEPFGPHGRLVQAVSFICAFLFTCICIYLLFMELCSLVIPTGTSVNTAQARALRLALITSSLVGVLVIPIAAKIDALLK
jgi:hypothetical protein